MSERLTAKQLKFCEEYLADLNATAAAKRSGYSEKTAYSIGQENLKKPEIAKKIEIMREEQTKRTEITTDRVIKELARGAFAEIPIEEMRPADKIRCIELLARLLGMFDGDIKDAKADEAAASKRILEAIERVKARHAAV